MSHWTNETKGGVILGYISIAFSLIAGMLLTPIIVRYLGKEDYGLYQLIGAFIAYLSVLDLGFGVAITRYIARFNVTKDEEGKENFLFWVIGIYGCITFLILIVGAILYSQVNTIFGESLTSLELTRAKKMVAMLVISTAITVFGNLFTGALDGEEKFIFPRLANIIKSCLNIVLSIFIVMSGANSVGLTLLNVILNIFTFVILAVFAMKFANLKIKYHCINKSLLKEVSVFSFYIFLQSMMSLLYWRIGGVVLGAMVGASSVAVFALAIQINHIFLYSTTAISSVLLPRASKIATTDATGEDLTDFMITPARYSLMIYALMTIGFIFSGKDFIQLWVGYGFENTYYIVVMIVLAGMIPRLQNAGNQLARAYNKQRFFTGMYFFMGLINIFTTVVLVKIWGEIGAALGTVAALIIGNTIAANLFYYKHLHVNVSRYFKETFKGIHWAIIISCIVGFFLNIFMPDISIYLSFLCKVVVISGVYMFTLLKFSLRSNEKLLIKNSLPVFAKRL